MLWPTATSARFCPFLLTSRRNCAARYVCFVCQAAHADWISAFLSYVLPLFVFPDSRLPALSWLPGHILAQLAR
jgi:hypothetical protein